MDRSATDQFSNEQRDLLQAVNGRSWWHRIDLGSGIVTPGADDSEYKLTWLDFPEDLSGKSVIDIGAWDGFFHSKPGVAVAMSWRPIIIAGMAKGYSTKAASISPKRPLRRMSPN